MFGTLNSYYGTDNFEKKIFAENGNAPQFGSRQQIKILCNTTFRFFDIFPFFFETLYRGALTTVHIEYCFDTTCSDESSTFLRFFVTDNRVLQGGGFFYYT